MASTPTEIVHLLSQVIRSVESANLHVQDGLNDGQRHHFQSATQDIERIKRGLEGALKLADNYLAQVGGGEIKCKTCNNAAKWKEADGGSNYYCSVECSKH